MIPVDTILQGDCREEMRQFPDASFDAIVTDPPYGLAFMGVGWDSFASPKGNTGHDTSIKFDRVGGNHHPSNAADAARTHKVENAKFQEFCLTWAYECFRVLKPGGHLLAFGGCRTHHRMVCAIEDSGFEIRDTISWNYGSGFPKSLNISKQLTQDDAKKWEGFGTSLKPAHEPIALARKPLCGTVAANVLEHGVGGLNIDGCRIGTGDSLGRLNHTTSKFVDSANGSRAPHARTIFVDNSKLGRFPANFLHDGSPEVLAEFAKAGESKSQRSMRGLAGRHDPGQGPEHNRIKPYSNSIRGHDDEGTAARFFQACPFTEEDYACFRYEAKASPSERNGSTHPTMKPLSLMRYLCRLITPPGGLILDPFAGSGTTCLAAKQEGFHFLGIELQAEYCEIARKRVASLPVSLSKWGLTA